MSEIYGICHICGKYGKLSKEHVPPKSSFNNMRSISVNFEQAITLGPDTMPKGPVHQGGIFFYTLCEKCNSNTGHWYGSRFIRWCYQGMDILIRTGGKPTLIYMRYLFPLAIIKQILTMFFSVNTEKFRVPNTELVQFVLNKEKNTYHLNIGCLSIIILSVDIAIWEWQQR